MFVRGQAPGADDMLSIFAGLSVFDWRAVQDNSANTYVIEMVT